jgi:hypothetical protein
MPARCRPGGSSLHQPDDACSRPQSPHWPSNAQQAAKPASARRCSQQATSPGHSTHKRMTYLWRDTASSGPASSCYQALEQSGAVRCILGKKALKALAPGSPTRAYIQTPEMLYPVTIRTQGAKLRSADGQRPRGTVAEIDDGRSGDTTRGDASQVDNLSVPSYSSSGTLSAAEARAGSLGRIVRPPTGS